MGQLGPFLRSGVLGPQKGQNHLVTMDPNSLHLLMKKLRPRGVWRVQGPTMGSVTARTRMGVFPYPLLLTKTQGKGCGHASGRCSVF